MTLQEIITHLSGADRERRNEAADLAKRLGDRAAPAAAALAAHAGDSDIGDACIAAMEKLGPPPIESLSALVELLSADEMPAYWSATLIGRLGADAAPAAEALAKTAERTAPLAVRERAVWALGKIGPGASAALPALEKLSRAPQPRLSRLAEHATTAIWVR